MSTVHCHKCNKESNEFAKQSSIGNIIEATNYNIIFSMEMQDYWLCEECATLVDAKARELIGIFDNEDISLGLLLKR